MSNSSTSRWSGMSSCICLIIHCVGAAVCMQIHLSLASILATSCCVFFSHNIPLEVENCWNAVVVFVAWCMLVHVGKCEIIWSYEQKGFNES